MNAKICKQLRKEIYGEERLERQKNLREERGYAPNLMRTFFSTGMRKDYQELKREIKILRRGI